MKSRLLKKLILIVFTAVFSSALIFSAVNIIDTLSRINEEISRLQWQVRKNVETLDRVYLSLSDEFRNHTIDKVNNLKNHNSISFLSGQSELADILNLTGALDIFITDSKGNISAAASPETMSDIFDIEISDDEVSVVDLFYHGNPLLGSIYAYKIKENNSRVFFLFMPESYLNDKLSKNMYQNLKYDSISDLAEKNALIASIDIYNITVFKNWSVLYPGKETELQSSILKKLTNNRTVKKRDGRYLYLYMDITPELSDIYTSGEEQKAGRVLELVINAQDFIDSIKMNALFFILYMTAALFIYFLYLNPLLKNNILNRLHVINTVLDEVISTGSFNRIYIGGRDELTDLSEKINSSITVLNEKNKKDRGKYEQLLKYADNLPLGLFFVSISGEIMYQNSYAQSLYEGESSSFTGIINNLLSRKDSALVINGLLNAVEGPEKNFSCTSRFTRGRGKQKIFKINIYLLDADEKLCLAAIADTSIESKKKLFDSGVLCSGPLCRITGIIANDLNNIMQIMTGFCEYLIDEDRDKDEVHLTLNKIIDTGKKADIFIRNMQTFSTLRNINMLAEVDVNSLLITLHNIIQSIAGKNIDLQFKPGEVVPVFGDEGLLAQVFISICFNAAEAMGEGGSLVVETGTAVYSDSDIKNRPDAGEGKYVFCSFTDTGCGIDPEDLENIFEPFFTTKSNNENTGFGLSSSYAIVMKHHGFISVSSEKNKGTVFTVNLPAALLETAAAADSENDNYLFTEKERNRIFVLFVDDEQMILSLGKIILEKEGYQVLTASSGSEAVDIFNNNRDKIGLVIADLVMPDISGKALVDKLRSEKPSLSVIYISGHSDGLGKMDIKEKVLKKPFKSAALLSAVKNITRTL